MSARMTVAACAPKWYAADCFDAVEERCRRLIRAAGACEDPIFDEAARAAAYHLNAGGRRIRARLALDAAFHLGLSAATAITIATTTELLHNASLVHDDLQDRDSGRRGAATVWKAFSDEAAICTGDLLLSSAYAALAELDDLTRLPQMLMLVHARTAAAIQCQSADIAHRTKPVENIETYLKIAAGKSGALLSLPLELALLAAGFEDAIGRAHDAAIAFAIGYQIADDLDDIEKDVGCANKRSALNIALLLQCNANANADAYGLAGDVGTSAVNDDESDTAVRQYCTALARKHLAVAVEVCATLPRHCGSMLSQLAVDLGARL